MKECVGKESDSFIVGVRRRNMVQAVGEGVRGGEILPWDMLKVKVKL